GRVNRRLRGGASLGWRPRLDRADVCDVGRGVRRVRGHPQWAGPLRRRDGRGVRRHADRIPGQDGRAETVRGRLRPSFLGTYTLLAGDHRYDSERSAPMITSILARDIPSTVSLVTPGVIAPALE